jgi:hypothetical protein
MELSEQTREILNDQEYITIRDQWLKKLKNKFEGKEGEGPGRTILAVNGFAAESKDPGLIYGDPEAWVVECLEQSAERIGETRSETMFKPLCIETAFYGVHFTDKIFGAEVFFYDDQWYSRKLPVPVGLLEYPDMERNPLWQTAKRAASAFIGHNVKLPLFGLPTIGSALNAGVNLLGEEILTSMALEPELAMHDLTVINDVLCDMHRWYMSVVPTAQLQPVISWNRTQPPGYGQLCGCSTQLISAEMYKDMVAPLDETLLGIYPNGGMMHLCGAHTHLIPAFREMRNLRAVQINDKAACELQYYFEGLRDDQIIYLNPCDEMPVKKALEITKGKRLVIADNID